MLSNDSEKIKGFKKGVKIILNGGCLVAKKQQKVKVWHLT